MNNFKELKFEYDKRHVDEMVKARMFIPGINSGAYTPSLFIQFSVEKSRRFRKNQKVTGGLNLPIKDVIELRDECNKIIEEAKRQNKILENE